MINDAVLSGGNSVSANHAIVDKGPAKRMDFNEEWDRCTPASSERQPERLHPATELANPERPVGRPPGSSQQINAKSLISDRN